MYFLKIIHNHALRWFDMKIKPTNTYILYIFVNCIFLSTPCIIREIKSRARGCEKCVHNFRSRCRNKYNIKMDLKGNVHKGVKRIQMLRIAFLWTVTQRVVVNSLPMFRDNLSVPSSRVKNPRSLRTEASGLAIVNAGSIKTANFLTSSMR
jgi:hypothetical protein